MPRYFFHLYDDPDILDEEGEELPDLEAARDRDIVDPRVSTAMCIVRHGRLNPEDRVKVTDYNGNIVLSVKLGEPPTVEP